MRFLEKVASISVTVLLSGTVLAGGSLMAHAESNVYEDMQNRQLSRRTGVNLQVIEQRQDRLDFQAQQQWNREQERRNASRPLELRVPTMRSGCRLPIYGNSYAGARCR